MMKVHSFFGRLDMFVRMLSFLCLISLSSLTSAEPVSADFEFDALIESAVNSWTDPILPDIQPLDEQIFTEISPLIDSPEGIRLPEDQQLAD